MMSSNEVPVDLSKSSKLGGGSSTKRFEFIDVGRAIAAGAVFCQHSIGVVSPAFSIFSSKFFSLGVFGVTLFFLISGFVIPPTLVKSKLKKFWVARFFRLYPLYWLVLITAFFVGLDKTVVASGHSPLVIFLANATMLQEFVHVPNALGVFWTLSMEMVLYFFCSALFVVGLLRRSDRIMLYVAVAMMVMCLACLFILHRSIPAGRAIMIFSACVGMWVYNQTKITPRSLLITAAIILPVLWASAYVRFSAFPVLENGEERMNIVSVFNSWLAAYIVFFVLRLNAQREFPRWLIAVGTWCYSIYLLHDFILHFVPQFLPSALWVIFCGILVLGVSYLSWRFVELPCINFGRRINKRLVPVPLESQR